MKRGRAVERSTEGPLMDRSPGGDDTVEGPGLRESKLTAKGWVEDPQEPFGPKVHAASVVKIIE
jgi:hypothetical protein